MISSGKAVPPPSELAKYRASDIPAFIKAGNLTMIHAISNSLHLGLNIMLLRGTEYGLTDEVTLCKGHAKVSVQNFNPMLLAVAFKRVDIVKYLLEELKVSLLTAC
jgi:hypothetical protein